MRFRKRPVVIEAVQLRLDAWSEMCVHAGVGSLQDGKPEGCFIGPDGLPTEDGVEDGRRIGMAIPTLEGVMIAVENDWVIRGVKGELYPCKPDVFAATYEAVDPNDDRSAYPCDLCGFADLVVRMEGDGGFHRCFDAYACKARRKGHPKTETSFFELYDENLHLRAYLDDLRTLARKVVDGWDSDEDVNPGLEALRAELDREPRKKVP